MLTQPMTLNSGRSGNRGREVLLNLFAQRETLPDQFRISHKAGNSDFVGNSGVDLNAEMATILFSSIAFNRNFDSLFDMMRMMFQLIFIRVIITMRAIFAKFSTKIRIPQDKMSIIFPRRKLPPPTPPQSVSPSPRFHSSSSRVVYSHTPKTAPQCPNRTKSG
jgi:hypothetical protein